MIVLNLECSQHHPFEGWFASSAAFEAQNANGQIACPMCGDTHIRRTPTAPYVQSRATTPAAPTDSLSTQVAHFVAELRSAAARAENVGKAFADEARKIHYGDAPERSIRGEASRQDVVELIEEGITVLPVLPDKEDLH